MVDGKDAAQQLEAYGSDPDPGPLIAAPKPQRAAFVRLQQLADRYAQIRKVRAHLQRLGLAPSSITGAASVSSPTRRTSFPIVCPVPSRPCRGHRLQWAGSYGS
jgi:hypothetical protein